MFTVVGNDDSVKCNNWLDIWLDTKLHSCLYNCVDRYQNELGVTKLTHQNSHQNTFTILQSTGGNHQGTVTIESLPAVPVSPLVIL